tara:strand:- start:436 stop:1722 length:1287 start_codon:yes stop_codon:yes gene_type:complete
MYWLIEEEEQLDILIRIGFQEAFIEVIPYNDNIHPSQNRISLLYIRPITATKGFVLCLHHSEALNVLSTCKTKIISLLNNFEKLYCYDKKEILHYLPLKSLYDINTPPTTYIRPTTQTHELYYSRHKDNPHLNLIIPVVKHYEKCEMLFGDLKNNINKEKTKYDEFFNSKTAMVFNAIEKSGIRIHNETFSNYFHPVDGEYIYTKFNLKTTTTRPSNSFKNVNYAALNKENGCRKSFIPRNDRFLEMDISAYHPTLAARLVGYDFGDIDVHAHFATLYNVDYKKSKELTFKQLYGGVFENYKHLEFFQKVEKYVGDTWNTFEKEGCIECPISSFVYTKENLGEMNPQKLFNYLLQNMETSQNVLVLWDMFCILRGKKTKLVLYTFDSFLLDIDNDENNVVQEIRDVFKKYKLNIKEIEGNDYSFEESN